MRGESHPEQAGIAVVVAGLRGLHPPFDVAVEHPVRFEQVFFVAGADRQHPLEAGQRFGDFVGPLKPIPSGDDHHAAIDFRRIAFDASEFHAGVIELVGEQPVEDVLIPLPYRGQAANLYHG